MPALKQLCSLPPSAPTKAALCPLQLPYGLCQHQHLQDHVVMLKRRTSRRQKKGSSSTASSAGLRCLLYYNSSLCINNFELPCSHIVTGLLLCDCSSMERNSCIYLFIYPHMWHPIVSTQLLVFDNIYIEQGKHVCVIININRSQGKQ